MSPNDLELKLINYTNTELTHYMMHTNLLHKEYICNSCNYKCKLVKHKKTRERLAWRCMTVTCDKYKYYISVRKDSLFENFKVDLLFIMRVLIRVYCGNVRCTLDVYFEGQKIVINNIIKRFENKNPVVYLLEMDVDMKG